MLIGHAPTQFAVGKAEVQVHAGRLRKKLREDPSKLHDYLRVRPIPVVVRGDRFYLVDHHQLTRRLYDALHETMGSKICAYVKVLENASTLEDHVQEELGITCSMNLMVARSEFPGHNT